MSRRRGGVRPTLTHRAGTLRLPLATRAVVAVATLLLGACTDRDAGAAPPRSQPERREIVVFAAASLTDAFDELARSFEQERPDVRVVTNYASSSRLAIQLTEGAPADIFASANAPQMETVIAAGRIDASTVEYFASNKLVALVAADTQSEMAGRISTFRDLALPGVRIAVAAHSVPVRVYTERVLERAAADGAWGTGFVAAFRRNIVSEESNVRQVAQRVALGEVDAGTVYFTDVTADIRDAVRVVEIPPAFPERAHYPIAPLSDSDYPEDAASFVAFVLSTAGREILATHRFGAPEESYAHGK